jgi:hypothetical protein
MQRIFFLFIISSFYLPAIAQQDSIVNHDSLSILADEITRQYNSSKVNFTMTKPDTPSFHLNLSPTTDNPVIFNQMSINNSPYNYTKRDPSNPTQAKDPLSAIIQGAVNTVIHPKQYKGK